MILHHGVNIPAARYTPARRISGYSPQGNVVRGHDISGKRFYKQLNPVQSIRDAAKPWIFASRWSMSGIRRCYMRLSAPS
jgi:hypothetical protein